MRLDGADIAEWDRDAAWSRTSAICRRTSSCSPARVAENIAPLRQRRSGQDGRGSAVWRDVHEMILRLPEGYRHEIGDGGSALSGGQRQRIGLARALYGSPRLVVLDEPNANLDAEGERALVATLTELKARRITVRDRRSSPGNDGRARQACSHQRRCTQRIRAASVLFPPSNRRAPGRPCDRLHRR